MASALLWIISGAAMACYGEAHPSHQQATEFLRTTGITVHSMGNCSQRMGRYCTSLDGIRVKALHDLVFLKHVSECPITITGGTEIRHALSYYSHWNGWKLDVLKNDCLKNYMTDMFRRVDNKFYCDGICNTYADEVNHYEINYGKSGKCCPGNEQI